MTAGARWGALAGLGAIVLLALAVRSLGFEWTFLGDGEVAFHVGDGHYEARRALVSFLDFPSVLVWDPYLNHPDGAPVPSPPLFPLLVAGTARMLGDSITVFEHLLAWAGPVLGAATVIGVYVAARAVAGPGVALGAAFIFSLLPVTVLPSQVGEADQHTAVVAVGTALLAVSLHLAAGRGGRWRLAFLCAGLALARTGMLLIWSGSAVYVGVADTLLLLAGVLGARRAVLGVQALSAVLTAMAIYPVLRVLPTPLGGEYSAIALSWLHLCGVWALAVVAGALWSLHGQRPTAGLPFRALRLVLVSMAACAGVLLVPGVREGIPAALDMLSTAPQAGGAISELLPLFPIFGRPVLEPAEAYYGYFAYLIPLTPLVFLIGRRDSALRSPARVLAGWVLVLGALGVWQTRYGADFAPAGSIAFAAMLAGAGRWLAGRMRLPGVVQIGGVFVVTVALLWPALSRFYYPMARSSLDALRSSPSPDRRALGHPSGSLTRFLKSVRDATPETSGYLGDGERPEYGILCRANIGHALHYVARRASTADGYMHLLSRERYDESGRFFSARSERAALAIAGSLKSRYAITYFFPGTSPGSVEHRLHFGDGVSTPRLPAFGHFRLVTEGPAGGRPLSDLFNLPRAAGVVPYKLFEIVPGALLLVRGEPGEPAEATVRVRTPTQRSFTYRTRAAVGAEGVARLRMPYATRTEAPARPTGSVIVRVGKEQYEVVVRDEEVRQGITILVPPAPL